MPTQSTIEEVTANATARTDKADRRLTNARSDVRIALRDINNAIDAEDGGTLAYHRDQAIGRLEFALTALRAAKGGA